MNVSAIFSLGQTALELGLICSLTVLALYLSYSMLNVCDSPPTDALRWAQWWGRR